MSPTVSLLVLCAILLITWCGSMMYMFHYGNWEKIGKIFTYVGCGSAIIWFIINVVSAILTVTLTSIA